MLVTTQTLKDRYAAQSCTLNDRPAIISGRLAPWAVVRSLDGRFYAEFSWPAVDRIMRERNGEFRL